MPHESSEPSPSGGGGSGNDERSEGRGGRSPDPGDGQGGFAGAMPSDTMSMGGAVEGPSDPAEPDEVADCERGSIFASEVVTHSFGTGQNHNQAEAFPSAVFGPPEASDPQAVVSLGNGGSIVLSFGDASIVDGPGPDFVVFENPFPGFAELATVSVSEDGVGWFEYRCTAGPEDEDFGTCAGVKQVFSRPDNGIDPLDPEQAGGDWYDLADVGLAQARFVRIVDRPDWDGMQGVFDLDAVGVRNASCE